MLKCLTKLLKRLKKEKRIYDWSMYPTVFTTREKTLFKQVEVTLLVKKSLRRNLSLHKKEREIKRKLMTFWISMMSTWLLNSKNLWFREKKWKGLRLGRNRTKKLWDLSMKSSRLNLNKITKRNCKKNITRSYKHKMSRIDKIAYVKKRLKKTCKILGWKHKRRSDWKKKSSTTVKGKKNASKWIQIDEKKECMKMQLKCINQSIKTTKLVYWKLETNSSNGAKILI